MKLIPVASTILFALSSGAHAATLTGSGAAASNNSTGAARLLPSGTDTDWGYWHQSGTPEPTVTSFNATNTSNTGGRLFTVTTLGGGNLRGPGTPSSGSPESFFDFTNGTPPAAPTANAARPSGIFNSQLGLGGANAGAGLQLSLTGFDTQSLIQIWTFGFHATGSFEVFLNGSSVPVFSQSVVSTSVSNGKEAYLFSLDFTPDSPTDVVDIHYFMTDQADGNAHVGFQTVAISPIPEPSSLALLGLGCATGFLRRRR